jgi:hypothetical protein
LIFDVYVFKDGDIERPAKILGFLVPEVNDNFTFVYASSEYTLEFHPSSIPVFVMVDASKISIVFELFRGFETRVKVPFPYIPLSPWTPVTPSIPEYP